MPAKKFLDLLEKQGFLDSSIINELRKQIAEASVVVTPEVIAKKLVESGHLTKFQATKLVGQAKEGAEKPVKKRKKRPQDEIVLLEDATDGEPDQPQTRKAKPQAKQTQPKPQQQAPQQQAPQQQAGLQPLGGLTPLGLDPLEAAAGAAGGVDDVLNDPSAGGEPAGGSLSPTKKKGWFGGRQASGGYKKPPPRTGSVWDTKLMLVGGAVLLLLLVAGTALLYSLTKGTAKELFNEAEADYKMLSYRQAIEKYDRFLRDYPNDENASLARVRKGMCRIWQVADDAQAALDMAKKVLPDIEVEEAFNEARPELASVLPEIARKFAVQAESTSDTMVAAVELEKAEQALELVNNATYIPTSLKKQIQGRINQIDETLTVVRHTIGKENKLLESMQKIQTASDAGDMKKVYAERDELLGEYPGLETNEVLRAQLLKVSARERTLVKLDAEPLETSTEERPGAGEQVVMAVHSGGTVDGVDQDIVLVRASSAVYGVNAKDGEMLWRRSVGDALSNPVRASVEVDANVLLNDAKHNEVVCIKPRSGELVWRTTIGEPFLGPHVTADEQVVITTVQGAVIKLSAQDGTLQKRAMSPLPVSVHATVKTRRPQIYQLAEHTNIYVHATADTDNDGVKHEALQCREVFYLGHKAGSVVTAPIVQLGFMFVAENKGPEACDLHILKLDAEGLALRTGQPPITLRGRVVVEPVIANRRLVVTTDLGSIYVFDVDPSAEKNPVTDAVEPLMLDRSDSMVSYALVDKASLWIGDNRLTRYNIQVAKSELSRRWVKLPGDVFRFPLKRIGNAVIHVRTPEGSTGVTVSAVNGDSGEPIWRTTIGASAGAAFFTPDGTLRAVSSRGRLYEAGEGSHASLVGDASGDGRGGAFLHRVDLGAGKLAVCSLSDRRRFVLVDKATGGEISHQQMATAAQPTAEPVLVAGGLAAGLASGEVVLIDPESGEYLVRPFYPTVAAGDQVRWFRAAPAGPESQELLITDNRNNVYRLAPSKGDSPYLSELSHRVLEQQVVSPAAAVADHVFVAVRHVEPEPAPATASLKKPDENPKPHIGDVIIPMTRVGLRLREPMPLQGRIVQGPMTVGDVAFAVSDSEGLICLEGVAHDQDVMGEPPEPKEGEQEKDGKTEAAKPTTDEQGPDEQGPGEQGPGEQDPKSTDAKKKLVVVGTVKSFIRWSVPLPRKRLAGPPVLDNGEYVIAFYDGDVWRISAADGSVTDKLSLNEPIVAAPVASADQFIFPGLDGTLRLLPRLEPARIP
jgi:outer membrane protein assembly factor BamB/TolA-binding protein